MTSILYYPVWISPGRPAGGWSWGKPCDTPREADAIVRERVGNGAVLGCVVRMADGERTPMAGHVYPSSAKRVVEHWERLWDTTETEHA